MRCQAEHYSTANGIGIPSATISFSKGNRTVLRFVSLQSVHPPKMYHRPLYSRRMNEPRVKQVKKGHG